MDDVRPDRSFMAQLKSLDKRLGCEFNGTHFVITFERHDRSPVNIWKVADERGGFRQPDQRELDMLRECDVERVGPDEKFNLVTEYMRQFRQDARDHAKQEIRDRTKDDKIQLVHSFSKLYGSGKGNSAFRRINNQP